MKNTLVGIAVGLLVGASIAPAGAHHTTDVTKLAKKVNSLQSKVSVLTKKTRYLDKAGFYSGPVFGRQVVSVCQTGSGAVWEPLAEGFTVIDDCHEGQSRQLRARYQQ